MRKKLALLLVTSSLLFVFILPGVYSGSFSGGIQTLIHGAGGL
ncbi:hypothetical protein J2T12_003413 [Paenibacillus anaericanus]|nr:hypothetical protein [Paenibacillus anaericanus]